MTTPAWPTSLPKYPLREGLAETAPFPVVQAQNDGPPLSRRRYTAAPAALTHTYDMDPTAFAAWETFYTSTIKFGSLPFTAPLRSATSATATYRITAAPRYERLGAQWFRVTLNLIRLP